MSITASSAALAKLEPFLLLAKNVRGTAAAKLIEEATAAPGCYVFSELLECDGIADLANDSQHGASYRKLELYAYGDLVEYHSAPPGTYPSLTEAQLVKLRHLTLVSLATHSRSLSYATLLPALGLGSGDAQANAREAAGPSSGTMSSKFAASLGPKQVRQLEDVVIDAMYAGVLSGRLDQRMQRLEVDGVMGRDVRGPAEVEKLATSLQEWSSITNHLLQTLQARINETRKADETRIESRNAHNEELKRVLLSLANRPNTAGPGGGLGGGGGGGGGAFSGGVPIGGGAGSGNGSRYDRLGSDKFGEMMDVDEDQGSRRKKAGGTGPMRSKRSRA